MDRIPFLDLKPLHAAERAELVETFATVLDSGRFILGPQLEAFEAEFAAFCGTRHAVGVGNGLDALYLVLRALGIGPGDEVIVPAHTFVATWLAVTRCGATPVPAEPDPATCLVTASGFAARWSSRTRAVVAVHLYGSAHGVDEIAALCRERGVPLVEDAAQAHGAQVGGRRAGSHGVAGCFSFYPSKNLGALGDGGAVTTDDAGLHERLLALRNYGGRERYVHDVEGVNSRLDELQAAVLRVRLRGLDAANSRRSQLAQQYLQRLGGVPGLQLPHPGAPGSHVWHLFVVQTVARDELQRSLTEAGIGTLIHYPQPVYRHPMYPAIAPAGRSVSDVLTARILSLPMGPQLSDAQVETVCSAVKSCLGRKVP